LAKTVPRADRRAAGRTRAARTPLALRPTGLPIDEKLRDYIHERLGLRLGKFALHIERVTVRFEDVNGPRGGRDVRCGIKVVLSGLPSVVVTELAGNALQAFNRADDRVERAVRRAVGRGRERGRIGRLGAAAVAGRGGATASRERARPTRATRAVAAAAARNYTRRPRKATAALEGSAQPRPSRKSTRGSANRAKQGNKLGRREQRRLASPKAKRARASHKR
jgi:ribosome-associated translation inhibitor RaiA